MGMSWRRSGLFALIGVLGARWYWSRLLASADGKSARGGQTSPLIGRLLQGLRHRRRREKIADSTGAALTGGALLTRSLVLRRLLRRHVLQPDERNVGILLPPTCAAVAANVALTLDRRVTVNLNYTLTSELMNSCIAQARIRHVVTSRRFMERMPLTLDAELVYLEDYREKPTLVDKVVGAFQGYLLPIGLLQRVLGVHDVRDDDLLTVVFTSGSTGQPKGAMLTYGNVSSNVEAVGDILRVRPHDVVLGILPFFHSFGYTITLWAVLLLDVATIYHTNPLEAKVIGKLARDRRGTLLLATPLFLRTYLRRCEPADFATLEAVITGGEKLPTHLADEFEKTFGLRPIEGYGTTETSPLISANIPPARAIRDPTTVAREGTVGKPAPGVRVKVTDLETGEELGVGAQGMLHVSGPNVMKGYLGQPEATAAAIHDGWYATGDVVTIDADGFITIVGRESRFAKIGGEMVPHGRIEEALMDLVGTDEDGGPKAVVTSIPDRAKGERLVVVHTALAQSPNELVRGLVKDGLPNLYIPSEDSFVQVDELPTTGTGKLDLKGVRQIAANALVTKARAGQAI
jgi:acyl-[acyl-carrier-protein]-phospholipid O-acyltransferase/long-chain-fatty-acid--[acyl-carrier-protein] ligase